MDATAKKKKALELMAARRPVPAAMPPSAPGGPAQSPATPSVASRFAGIIAKRQAAGKK